MKRTPLVFAAALLLAAGGAFWIRRGADAPSGPDPIEQTRLAQARALEKDAKAVRRLEEEPRPPGTPSSTLGLPAVPPALKDRVREAFDRKEPARLAFEETLRRNAAAGGAGTAVPGGGRPAPSEPATPKDSARDARVALRVETAPAPLLALQPVPLRLVLTNEGDAEIFLHRPPNPRMSGLSISVRRPGESDWKNVLLFPDTSGQSMVPERRPLAPGARLALHVEPILGLGYDAAGRRFLPGRYRLRVQFNGIAEPTLPPPAGEVDVEVTEPQGRDRTFLMGLIEAGRVSFLGARAPVVADATPAAWQALAASLAAEGASPYAQDLRAGLLALAREGKAPPAEGSVARNRKLADGLPHAAAWPRAERLLLQAWAAEQAGDSAAAENLRRTFEGLCPDDVRLNPGR